MSAVQKVENQQSQPDIDVDEFLAGQRDCVDGIPHKSGRSESYDRGYGAQYEMEQIKGALYDH